MTGRHKLIALVAAGLLSAAAPFTTAAKGIQTLTGEATYYGDATDSPAEAKRKALDQARINALAREFGTVLSQTTVSRDVADNGAEQQFFSSLSASEVKGEWIADEGEPKFTIELDSDGHYVVHCRVTIKAKELSNKAADFHATVLRNGLTDKHASTEFKTGDEMFLAFRSPADGYVAAYLVAGDDVLTLLPYTSSASGKCPVRHDRDYIFFSAPNGDKEFGTVDEYLMQTDGAFEHDRLYVLFSPNEFSKALDRANGDSMPRVQPYEDFVKWIAKLRRADGEMGMKVFNLTISQ